MKQFFINPESKRLRAGWRILSFFVIFIAIAAVVMIGVRAILGGLKGGSDLQFGLVALSATAAVFIARRFIDKKSLVSLGLKVDKFAVLDVLSGIVIAALIMAGTYFLMLGTGLIDFQGFTWWRDELTVGRGFEMAVLPIVLAVLLKLTFVAWWEELVFRGYLLQNMIEGIGLTWSVLLTSVVFGGGHFFNANATLLSTLLITLITPQLIYAYIKSGQLWLPVGLHLGWNFFQASVFGFAASGNVSPSLISQSSIGPDWLSGGPFGAEGSLLILPFTILSFFLIHYWVRMTRQPEQRAKKNGGWEGHLDQPNRRFSDSSR